jgi:fido (protein-threonine AMPylation protein)
MSARRFIDENMARFEREFLAKHPASGLTDDEDFCGAVAQIQGEFLVIHPFREGNARCITRHGGLTARPIFDFDFAWKN